MSEILFYLAIVLGMTMVLMAAWAVLLHEKYMFCAATTSAATLFLVAFAGSGLGRSIVLLVGILLSHFFWRRARKVLDFELTT